MAYHHPRRRFGQNFLHDQNVLSKIIEAIPVKPPATILEIGPGRGALTTLLLKAGYKVIAIEIDRDLVAFLESKEWDNFLVISQDVLSVNLSKCIEEYEISCVIGNLPYNISTPFLLQYAASTSQPGLFLLQKEVGDRLKASPGQKDFGRLTLALSGKFEIHNICEVSPQCFYPAPKVHSIVLKFLVKSTQLDRATYFQQIVNHAFQHRRKTIKNALLAHWEIDYDQAKIDSSRRPETLSEQEFNELALFAHPKSDVQ